MGIYGSICFNRLAHGSDRERDREGDMVREREEEETGERNTD